MLLCGFGVWLVIKAAQASADNAKADALSRAKDAAAEYSELVTAAFSLTKVLASLVRHDPQYSAVSRLFNATVPALFSAAPCSCILNIDLVPAGVMRQVYPDVPENRFLQGMDLFGDQRVTEVAINAVSEADLSIQGPLPPLEGSSVANSSVLMMVRQAIHLPVTGPGEDWGRPDEPNPACGAPCKYNSTTGTKFWGFVAVVIQLNARTPLNISDDSNYLSGSGAGNSSSGGSLPLSAPLRSLENLGYRYVLLAPALSSDTKASGGSTTGDPWAASVTVVASSPGGAGEEVVETPVELVPGLQWTLLVGPTGSSWMPSWYGGIVALVVVVSLAAAVLLFGLLVSRRRSTMLLRALLPPDMIQDLNAEAVEEQLQPKPRKDWESPADVLMELLNLLLAGLQPDLRDVVLLRTVLRRRLDVYRPFNLQARLREAQLDTDVASALMRALGNPADLRLSSGSSANGPWQEGGSSGRSSSTGEEDFENGGWGGEDGKAKGGASGKPPPGEVSLPNRCTGGSEEQSPEQRQQRLMAHCESLKGALEYILRGGADEDEAAARASASPLVSDMTEVRPSGASAAAAAAAAARRPGAQQGCSSGGGRRFQPSRNVSSCTQRDADPAATHGSGGSGSAKAPALPPRPPLPSAIPRSSDDCAELGRAAEEPSDGVGGGGCAAAVSAAAAVAATDWSSSARRRSRIRSLGSVKAVSPQPLDESLGAGAGSGPPVLQSAWSCPQQQDAVIGSRPGSAVVSFLHPAPDPDENADSMKAPARAPGSKKLLPSARGPGLVDEAPDMSRQTETSGGGAAGVLLSGGAANGKGRGEGGGGGGGGAASSGSLRGSPVKPAPPASAGGQRSPRSPAIIPPGNVPPSGGEELTRAGSPQQQLLMTIQQSQQDLVGEVSGPPLGPGAPSLERSSPGWSLELTRLASSNAPPQSRGPPGSGGPTGQFHVQADCRGPGGCAPGNPPPRDGLRRGINSRSEGRCVAAAGVASPTRGSTGSDVEEGAGAAEAEAEARFGTSAVTRRLARVDAANPPRPLVEEVERLLSCADHWQFDTWGLQEASCGHALSSLGFFLVQRAGLVERLQLDPVRLARLFRTLESGYPASNPYHNSAHAADVLHTLHVLLHGTRLTVHYLDAVGLLAAYFAAAVHDYGHPGLTNDFLVATSHPLALRYNDRSPLESHHAAAFFSLLAERPDLDITAVLTREQRAAFRMQVVDLILATDMKQHFAILNQFNTVHRLATHYATLASPAAVGPSAAVHNGCGDMRSPDGTTAHAARGGRGLNKPGGLSAAATSEHIVPPTPLNDAERTLSLQVMLKAADIGHLGAGLEGHKRWLSGLEEEFFRQGDRERQLGLPVSALFQRGKRGVSKSQVGFYEFVALPLVRAATEAFPGVRPLLECFRSNYYHWRLAEALAEAEAS